MKKLTTKQRAFLEYIYNNHSSIGWPNTVEAILQSNEYNPTDVSYIPRDWHIYVTQHSYTIFGTPTKYLK